VERARGEDAEPLGSEPLPSEIAGMAREIAREIFVEPVGSSFLRYFFFLASQARIARLLKMP
jgi:hypothetical protein